MQSDMGLTSLPVVLGTAVTGPDGQVRVTATQEGWDLLGPRKQARLKRRMEQAYRPVRWRASELTCEVRGLYNAMSFLTWRYDLTFNTHVTLTASKMGITDQREFAELLPQWNKEMKRWLANGNDRPRQRQTRHARPIAGQPHHWMYVMEYGRVQGLHVHQLCVVPKELMKAFAAKTRDWWAHAACLADLPKTAIKVEARYPPGSRSRYERQVEWFRYIAKSARRDFGLIGPDGVVRTYEEIFKLDPHWETDQIYVPQLTGISHSLSAAEQNRRGFVSRLEEGRFEKVYSGWELNAALLRKLET